MLSQLLSSSLLMLFFSIWLKFDQGIRMDEEQYTRIKDVNVANESVVSLPEIPQ